MLDRIDIAQRWRCRAVRAKQRGWCDQLSDLSLFHTSGKRKSVIAIVPEDGDTPLNDFYLRTGGWLTGYACASVEGNFLKGESFRETFRYRCQKTPSEVAGNIWVILKSYKLSHSVMMQDTANAGCFIARKIGVRMIVSNGSWSLYDEYQGKSGHVGA